MALAPQQTEELKGLISRRRSELAAELRRDAGRTREESYSVLAGSTHDSGDEAVAALLSDVGHAELSRDLAEMLALQLAERRMAEGSYGVCIDCGADIDFERLKAAPGAPRCVACQMRHEKTFASGEGSSL
jgi:DnaK suppressor protein